MREDDFEPFYAFWRGFCLVSLKFIAGVKYYDVPNAQDLQGGLLIVSNHQSFVDPGAIGAGLPVQLSFLARDTLFRVPGFGSVIRRLGTFPVKRGRTDAGALKAMIRILRGGGKLMMFPEGTRSPDGELGLFKPGAAAVAAKCGVPILPACVEGGFQVWPRTALLPRRARMAVAYGKPIDTTGRSGDDLTEQLRAEIARMQGFLRAELRG